MESRGEIIDLAVFRKNESQELSLIDLVEQAEALVILQEAAALDQSRSQIPSGEPDHRVITVANSLQHLRRHLGIIKRLIPLQP
jgi:hypothetical protein